MWPIFHAFVTVLLWDICIGSVLWGFVFSNVDDLQGTRGRDRIAIIIAHGFAIVLWPIVLCAMIGGAYRLWLVKRNVRP